ncbi:MAG TPA: DinB family protein [Chloroflexia bacterium]|nr:DinB family protein [Chloroflexia bacterium]
MSETAVPNPIVKSFSTYIMNTVDRIMNSLSGLDEQQLNWRPPAPETNSLYVIASHVLMSTQENILKILGGIPAEQLPLKAATRDEIFSTSGNTTERLMEDWSKLRSVLESQFRVITENDLAREINHPRRGKITGLEVLLAVTSHMAEHLGHAELTRDLVKAL